jgi:glycosyltransferase involved in cell wall biosynthesis
MKLSIVVPAYNEETRLPPMLDAYLDYFVPRYGNEMELIMVVNGSSDGTEQLVRSYKSRFPQVRLSVEPQKIGKGRAVVIGFDLAEGELVGFTDADGATPPQAYQDLVGGIGDAGAIIASRWLPGSDVSPRQPLSRRIASRIFNWKVRMLFGLKITDTQCGAKLFTREALLAVRPFLGSTRWAFDVDLLFHTRRSGYEIREIPTTWHDVKGSKVNVPRASAEMTLAIWRLRLLYSPLHWVVTVYDTLLGRRLSKRK